MMKDYYQRSFILAIQFKKIIMANGTVKFFNSVKGFGFITPESGDKDVFVHVNGTIDDINDGDNVSFDVEEGPKGLNAVNVKVV
ncbi:MAG: CspA family cold shock protein [Saprospiraceae bacterium]|jgi:CspA family cold shock protein